MQHNEQTFSQEKNASPAIVTDRGLLRRKSRDVTAGDKPVELADILFRMLKEYRAQGLSAVQIGRHLRLFVINNEPGTPVCLVNPLITKVKGRVVAVEGCLSLPAPEGSPGAYLQVAVPRPRRITIEGLNQYLKPVRYRLEGIKARRACHEFDHINGKLIIDYLEEGND